MSNVILGTHTVYNMQHELDMVNEMKNMSDEQKTKLTDAIKEQGSKEVEDLIIWPSEDIGPADILGEPVFITAKEKDRGYFGIGFPDCNYDKLVGATLEAYIPAKFGITSGGSYVWWLSDPTVLGGGGPNALSDDDLVTFRKGGMMKLKLIASQAPAALNKLQVACMAGSNEFTEAEKQEILKQIRIRVTPAAE